MIKICTFRTAANTTTTTTTCPVSVGAVLLPLLPWRRVTQDRGSRSLLITIDPIPIYFLSHRKSERIYPVLVNHIHLFSAAISFIPSTGFVKSSGKFGKKFRDPRIIRNVYLLYV